MIKAGAECCASDSLPELDHWINVARAGRNQRGVDVARSGHQGVVDTAGVDERVVVNAKRRPAAGRIPVVVTVRPRQACFEGHGQVYDVPR